MGGENLKLLWISMSHDHPSPIYGYGKELETDVENNGYIHAHVYSLGQGQNPQVGSKLLHKHKTSVTVFMYCKFLPFNDFRTIFPICMHVCMTKFDLSAMKGDHHLNKLCIAR